MWTCLPQTASAGAWKLGFLPQTTCCRAAAPSSAHTGGRENASPLCYGYTVCFLSFDQALQKITLKIIFEHFWLETLLKWLHAFMLSKTPGKEYNWMYPQWLKIITIKINEHIRMNVVLGVSFPIHRWSLRLPAPPLGICRFLL